jgi:hypothetical protein
MIKNTGGQLYNIQGLDCYVPRKGYIYNPFTKKEEYFGIEKRSTQSQYCYWEVDKRFAEYQKWEQEEKDKRKKDPQYIHPDLAEFKEYCWIRRLSGHWYQNNNEAVYITGVHWFYLSCYHLDIGLPKYRDVDREFFYAWEYAVEDDTAFGLTEVTKRRSGKTYRAGCIALEAASRSENFWAGIQSKTDDDAKAVFRKAIVNPYRKLPSFFRPVSDLPNTGKVPATGLRFNSGRIEIDGDELMSGIDFKASVEGAYDGQKLGIYIGDEVGKTINVDVNKRWDVVRFCLMDDEGRIIGKALHTTTVEEMESGGAEFFEMWKGSDQLNKIGKRTKTGMYRFFTPADRTRFIDQYGRANQEKAREDILQERLALREDPRALSSAKRKEPLDEKEAFQVDSSICVYNPIKLNDRLDILKWTDTKVKRGNFGWENGIRDTKVVFTENPNGKFLVSYLPTGSQANQFKPSRDGFMPLNNQNYTAGIDPYDHKEVSDSHRSRMSMGSLCIMKKYNPLNESPVDNGPCLLYVNRPDSPEVFYEDCLMALAYYGVHALIENQKPGIIHYFERRGYKPFSYFIPGNKEPGIAATNRNNTYISEVTDQFINDHIDTVYFEELIEDWLQFNPEKTTKYDAAMAFGYALTMMVNINFSPDKVKQEAKIEDYLPFFRKSNGKGLFGRY